MGVDVKKIMEEIEKRVEEKKRKGIYTEDLDAIANEVLRNTEVPDEVEYYLQKVNTSWYLDDQTVTTIHRGVKGKLLLLEKKIVKTLVRPWLCKVVDTQRDFNSLVVKVLNALVRKFERSFVGIDGKIKRIEHKLEGVAKRMGVYERPIALSIQPAFLRQETRRFEKYLKYFAGRKDVVDVTCRDVAFLKFMQENGIKAYGVVSDKKLLEGIDTNGFDIRGGDVLDYLFELPSDLLGGIFASVLAELLTPGELRRFLASSYDVLEPGAYVVVEILNPHSVSVLRDFWQDIVALRPVSPEALVIVFKELGFVNVEAIPMLPFSEGDALRHVDLDGVVGKVINGNIRKLNEMLFGYRCYAVVGRKPE